MVIPIAPVKKPFAFEMRDTPKVRVGLSVNTVTTIEKEMPNRCPGDREFVLFEEVNQKGDISSFSQTNLDRVNAPSRVSPGPGHLKICGNDQTTTERVGESFLGRNRALFHERSIKERKGDSAKGRFARLRTSIINDLTNLL